MQTDDPVGRQFFNYTQECFLLSEGALPHKKSNFVNNRCLKKDVTFRQYTSAVGGAYDEPTKQTRVICRGTTEIFEGQQSREAKDSR